MRLAALAMCALAATAAPAAAQRCFKGEISLPGGGTGEIIDRDRFVIRFGHGSDGVRVIERIGFEQLDGTWAAVELRLLPPWGSNFAGEWHLTGHRGKRVKTGAAPGTGALVLDGYDTALALEGAGFEAVLETGAARIPVAFRLKRASELANRISRMAASIEAYRNGTEPLCGPPPIVSAP